MSKYTEEFNLGMDHAERGECNQNPWVWHTIEWHAYNSGYILGTPEGVNVNRNPLPQLPKFGHNFATIKDHIGEVRSTNKTEKTK